MDFNKFTIKAQETVQAAISRVQSLGQQAIEPVHILNALISVGEQVAMFLLHKTGANIQQIKEQVERAEKSLPKVSGGEPYLSRESNEIFTDSKELFEVLWTDWLEHHLLTPVLGTPVAELDYDMLYEILPPEKKEAFMVEKQEFWNCSWFWL